MLPNSGPVICPYGPVVQYIAKYWRGVFDDKSEEKMKTLFEHEKKDSPEDMYETSDVRVEDRDKVAGLSQCRAMGYLTDPCQGLYTLVRCPPF